MTSSPHPECAKPTTAPCVLAPLQDRQVPGRPVLEPLRAGIVLILQAEQHEMAGVARREAGDLQVVVHQPRRRRQRMIDAAEELLLEVVRRPPGQHRREVERFAVDLRPHVFRPDALGRILVVRAAGRVDVVIAGIPAVLRRIDPAQQLKDQLGGAADREALASAECIPGRGVAVTVNCPAGRLMVWPSCR